MDSVRQQARDLEHVHLQQHLTRLDRYTAHKPELKEQISVLSQQRDLIDEEIRRLEARLSNAPPLGHIVPATPSATGRPGSTSHFAQLSDADLKAEQARLQHTLLHIDGQILSTKAVFAQPRREQERDIWEAQLIILQVASPCNGLLHPPHLQAIRCTLYTGHQANASGRDRQHGSGKHQPSQGAAPGTGAGSG